MTEPRPSPTPIPGVHALDHTADVGLEFTAPDLPELLRRAALGLTWLLLEREPSGPSEERKVHVRADAPAALLRELLRELLWWHEAEGLVPEQLTEVRVHRDAKAEWSVDATVRAMREQRAPVREIKGVTLHALVAERRGDAWHGSVIFDV
jgi:SHS2 domain-containing protein